MTNNKILLKRINESIKECTHGDTLKILKNFKKHLSKVVKNQEITDTQYDNLISYFYTIFYLFIDKEDDWDEVAFYRSCSHEMRELYGYFEETEILQKMFKKYNIWEQEEFIDEFEDELNDNENPKWYSYNIEGYVKNEKIAKTPPSRHGEISYYLLINKKEKTIRTFYCFDNAVLYVYVRDYNEFNKDYIDWVLNNPELQE